MFTQLLYEQCLCEQQKGTLDNLNKFNLLGSSSPMLSLTSFAEICFDFGERS